MHRIHPIHPNAALTAGAGRSIGRATAQLLTVESAQVALVHARNRRARVSPGQWQRTPGLSGGCSR